MYVITTEEMKYVENNAINNMGVPSILLMENAARGVTEEVLKLKPKNVLVVAGKGNNGGDALAIARQLIANHVKTTVLFVGDENKATNDCLKNLNILKNYNINIFYDYSKLKIENYDIVLDGLIGTGLKNQIKPEFKPVIDLINNGNYIISIDCPSGVNSDTGENYDLCVNAHMTITFHLPKIGLLFYPAYENIGKLIVKNIGIPYINTFSNNILTNPKKFLPKRYNNSHKGTYGKVLFISGSENMTGAAFLNGLSAYRSGCGLVNICINSSSIPTIQKLLPEAVLTPRENLNLDNCQVIAIGSGLGITNETINLVDFILNNNNNKFVIADADALNIISKNENLKYKTAVITPHLKEMSRLTNYSTSYIKSNLLEVAKNYAKKYNTVVVLKDSHTVISSPSGETYINLTGNNAMSKGGSGDLLTGTISSLIAQGKKPFEAAVLGAYINGKACEIASNNLGFYGVLAQDIANNIPLAINSL